MSENSWERLSPSCDIYVRASRAKSRPFSSTEKTNRCLNVMFEHLRHPPHHLRLLEASPPGSISRCIYRHPRPPSIPRLNRPATLRHTSSPCHHYAPGSHPCCRQLQTGLTARWARWGSRGHCRDAKAAVGGHCRRHTTAPRFTGPRGRHPLRQHAGGMEDIYRKKK